MKFETINDLKEAGFEGFVSMSELWSGKSPMLPRQMGVYMVVRTADEAPAFVETGTGGHFKGKNPNVSIKELQENWVDGTCVLYIGKAGGLTSSATLYKRLGQYMKFGQGEPVGHWGGRYIWQLEDAADLIVCWKPLSGKEPATLESQMISDFKAQHSGKRPFANLKD